MVGGFLFLNGSGNTTSWLVGAPNPSFGVGRHSHVQLGGAALAWLYHSLCDGVSRSGANVNLRGYASSYRSGCGSVSWSLGHSVTTLRYALGYFFSLYIFYVKCLGNNLKFNFQSWPFEDAESQPLLGYR
jgi:hypothetical protein